MVVTYLSGIFMTPDTRQVENIISTYEPQACMVVYSIIDKESYNQAEETLQYLETQKRESGIRRAKILVHFSFIKDFRGQYK